MFNTGAKKYVPKKPQGNPKKEMSPARMIGISIIIASLINLLGTICYQEYTKYQIASVFKSVDKMMSGSISKARARMSDSWEDDQE